MARWVWKHSIPTAPSCSRTLKDRGWKLQELKPYYEVWGGAHGIRLKADGTLEGGADPRREGAVRGW